MKILYLHLGLPKTATSFLQQEVFPQLKTVHYLEMGKEPVKGPLLRLMQQKLTEKDYQEIRKILEKETKSGKNLISNEGFFGGMYYPKYKDRIVLLQDLKKTFHSFQVKIIVGIREQADYISSLYKQYLHEGGAKRLTGFLQEMEKHNTSGFLNAYRYSLYLQELGIIFGRKNIYVYVYEQLNKDQPAFMWGLLEFLGEKAILPLRNTVYNRGYGAHQMRLARFLNRFFKSSLNPQGFIPAFKIPKLGRLSPRLLLQNRLTQKLIYKKYAMPEAIAAKIRGYYAADNKKVKEEYALDLPEIYFKE